MVNRTLKGFLVFVQELGSMVENGTVGTKRDAWRTHSFFLWRLLPMFCGEIEPQDSFTKLNVQLGGYPWDPPPVFRIECIPTPATWGHILFSFAPSYCTRKICGVPANSMGHRKTQNVNVKILRPLKIHYFHGSMVDPLDLSGSGQLSIGCN